MLVRSSSGRMSAISWNLSWEGEEIEYSLNGFISGKNPLIISLKLYYLSFTDAYPFDQNIVFKPMPDSGSGVVCFIDLDHLIAITVGDILADPIEHECPRVYFPTRTFYAISIKPYSSLFASCMQLKLLGPAIVPCVSILLVIWVFFPTGNSAYQMGIVTI